MNIAIVGLSGLWNRVDLTARLLQPWATLRAGSSSAERTIFLDLVSPSWPTVLKTAALREGFVPLLTISGSIFLQIAVSISTLNQRE